jgi:hypothetical protein
VSLVGVEHRICLRSPIKGARPIKRRGHTSEEHPTKLMCAARLSAQVCQAPLLGGLGSDSCGRACATGDALGTVVDGSAVCCPAPADAVGFDGIVQGFGGGAVAEAVAAVVEDLRGPAIALGDEVKMKKGVSDGSYG